ncbi:MAG: hypothetical protein JWL77_124 [Chthonomonadaceae bacterium]|nr:hypothetical protein [Chthonomonadaceae bacterium]
MDRARSHEWARSRLIALASIIACAIGLAGTAHAAGQYLEVNVSPISKTSDKATPQKSAKPKFDKKSPFYFDGAISRRTLENYLDHSITMNYLLVPGKPEGYQFPYRNDDVRMIHNLGAKFIGRAIYRWGEESKLGDPAFLEYAKKMVDRVHNDDPEVVFQGCLFEQVSADVNNLKIPAWVFTDFGLPVEDRTFSCAAIIKWEGRPDRGGDRGGVPIINNLETRLWFYYLAASYINIGCEALHLGQVGLIGADDKDLKIYSEFLAKVRTYAKLHARRHMVLMDGHVPTGGMVKDGVSLLDYNAFPMRIKAVADKPAGPGKPQEAILEVGHLDAIFKRSKGCISPSGWKCDSLPYLVEFDNFGRGPNPNVADPKSMWCWGWDEISWFAQQPEAYRNQWLRYAYNWIKQTDPNGHLEMPGARMISCPNETLRTYFANTKSPTCPVGYSQEETIKEIWKNRGQSPPAAFEGEKTQWHGFDRYDFLMDETDLTIKPYKVAPDERNAVRDQVPGQRRCVVVVPKAAAPGNPWSWQGCYWDHEPQTEVELLRRGFHIAFAAPDADAQGKVWDAWYQFLTEKHGLAKKAAFVGMSKGGVNEFNWGVVNPDKVACIYADNPALYDEDFAKLSELAKHGIPLLHVCGSEDFLLQRYTRVVEETYHQLGGLVTVIIKEGHAHHPHSLQNPKPIADWIEQHMTPSTANRPAFVDATFTKGYYYSLEPSYIYLKEEDTYATARGPGFTECYDRYDGPTSGKFKMGGISIIVPKTVAPGKPWVFTGDPIERDSTVEQALLAKGYHILIVSPMGSGMTKEQWNDAYKLLVENGFSNKPVLKGTGAMAGEAYAWAIANPDRASCVYARDPLMRSLMAGKEQPIDNLAALAKAGVPLLHDCGASDPWLETQTRVVENRYKQLGGKITVVVRKGEGHFPLSPKDPKSVVEFIVSRQETKPTNPSTHPLEGSQAGIGHECRATWPFHF